MLSVESYFTDLPCSTQKAYHTVTEYLRLKTCDTCGFFGFSMRECGHVLYVGVRGINQSFWDKALSLEVSNILKPIGASAVYRAPKLTLSFKVGFSAPRD